MRVNRQTTTASLFNSNTSNVILAAPLFRIRANRNKIIPEYLLWAINQPKSQAYLATRSKGTMVKMISKDGLENLELELPSLERQKLIAKIYKLSRYEQKVLKSIEEKRHSYIQGILMQIASAKTTKRSS